MDRYQIRREDYSLSTDQTDLREAYAKFFATHCPIDTVRDADATGFDPNLWSRLCATGATSMAIPESAGGDGATLVDLALVAEEVGRSLAPVPWIDHVVATRLLARLNRESTAPSLAAKSISGERIVGFDPVLEDAAWPRLIPAATVAHEIVARVGDDVVRLEFESAPARVENLGRLPMAWVDPSAAARVEVLASGADAVAAYQVACDEWRLLTASALVGLVEQTMRIAVDFAVNRRTLGVPISTLQGISHPLANMAIVVESGRAIVAKAAWFAEHEPQSRPELAGAAFVFMAEEAPKAATMAVHVQGGLGVSTEAVSADYFVRARGWPLAGGDPVHTASRVARLAAVRDGFDAVAVGSPTAPAVLAQV